MTPVDPSWWFEKFGTVGLMLAAMLWDRTRLLKQIEGLQSRVDGLTDKLIDQAQDSVSRRIEQDKASIDMMERMARTLSNKGRE